MLPVKVSSNKYIVETLRSSIISGYTHLLTCIPLPYSLLLSFSSVNVKGMNESNISRRYTPPSTSKSCKLRRNLLKTVETPKRKGVHRCSTYERSSMTIQPFSKRNDFSPANQNHLLIVDAFCNL